MLMNIRFTALRLPFLLIALALLGILHSQEVLSSEPSEEEVMFNQLETRLGKLEKQERYGTKYNPGAAKSYGLLLGADALYWQARENGIPYAVAVNNPLQQFLPPPDFVLKSHVKEFDFDWDFGVRVHGGVQFHRDDWRILATWTHFDTKAQDHGFTTANTGFQPIWSDPLFLEPAGFASHIKAKWKLFMNQVDLMLSRAFYTGRYFVLEPAVGLSGVWIDQHLHSRSKVAIFQGFSRVKLENEYKGLGLRGGLNTRFCIKHGFSIFNTTHLGLYYGEFELERKEKFFSSSFFILSGKNSMEEKFRQITSLIAMQMGIGWDYGFRNNRCGLSVKLAYEYQIFFAQNQFMRVIKVEPLPEVLKNQGDLALMGGTLSVLFTF
ncbi:MAG: hypothetical protein JSR93_01500 [Verrucomicrobia bacterium]|nr:hypothetical protein [Verrucomicrobiota bacterium]